MKNLYLYVGGVAVAVMVSALLAWFIFASTPATTAPSQTGTSFGSLNDNSTSATTNTATTQNTPNIANTTQAAARIFKISEGPVAGATFVQTLRPTTTLARFVMADNGHAFDLALDSSGAVARPLSNTTIPGALSARWAGGSAVLQYLDGTVPKTVYLGLPTSGATTSAPVRLQFYPDGIVGLAVSPDGSATAYLLPRTSGVDGYISKPDGTGSKKLFSLPLTQVQLRWPSTGTLLAYSNAAADVPGIAFAIDAKSGVATPLVYAPGLTATADLSFSHVLYQTTSATARTSYSHDVASGADRPLSFDPYPEKCAQGAQNTTLLCAVPLSYVASSYLDLWHRGAASAADSLVAFDLTRGTSNILTTPGGADGGAATDILTLSISADGRYALFVSKFDRSLWGVRL